MGFTQVLRVHGVQQALYQSHVDHVVGQGLFGLLKITPTQWRKKMKIKLPKYDAQMLNIITTYMIGNELNGKLKNQTCLNECPGDIAEIVDFYLEKAYNKGVMDMHASMQDLLFETVSNSYEYDLEYSYGQHKENKE